MPVQQQNSNFAQRLGGRIADAHTEHKDKPVDTGNLRLPPGIRNGVAKLSTMYTKQQDAEDGKTPKGEHFFRASAVAIYPESHANCKVAGVLTSVIIPLCDVPAKGQRKAVPFTTNWYEFQNLFKVFGVMPPTGPQYDVLPGMSDAQKAVIGNNIQAYYFAAMKALTDPKKPPVYFRFTTRGWTPPKTPQQPNPSEMVFEEWGERITEEQLAEIMGQHDPGAGMTQQPLPHDQPPASLPASTAPTPAEQNGEPVDLADEVAMLVEVAMGDPEGATEDGKAASMRLEELAWEAGWSREQTTAAADWAEVGDMVLNPAEGSESESAADQQNSVPSVGARFLFAKRTKDGARLKDNKGKEFPAQEVEITSVDEEAKTCTVKTKEGKDVVDIRTRKPTVVKWEWLEDLPY